MELVRINARQNKLTTNSYGRQNFRVAIDSSSSYTTKYIPRKTYPFPGIYSLLTKQNTLNSGKGKAQLLRRATRRESLLPFWPVIKFTESPKSISRLLWHIKFSTRILEMVPAWFDFGLPKTLGFAIDSTCNNLLLMITMVSSRWVPLQIEQITENESGSSAGKHWNGVIDFIGGTLYSSHVLTFHWAAQNYHPLPKELCRCFPAHFQPKFYSCDKMSLETLAKFLKDQSDLT